MKNTLSQRLWLFVMACCVTLGMSAQYITSLSQLKSGEYYRFVNVERGEALTAVKNSTTLKQAAINRSDRKQRWLVTLDSETGYYTLKNDETGTYIAKPANTSNGTQVFTGATAGNFTIRKTTISTDQATYFNILPQGTTTGAFNNYGGNTADGTIKLYEVNAGGEWQIESFPEKDFADAAMFERGIFRIRNRRSGTLYITENQTTHALVGSTKKSTSKGDYSQIWCLAAQPEGGYVLYNMESGRTVGYSEKNKQFTTEMGGGDSFYFSKSSNSTAAATYWNVGQEASYADQSKEMGLNMNPGGQVVGWTFTGDQGSDWTIVEVDDSEVTLEQAREAILEAQNAPVLEAGKYYYLQNFSTKQVMQEDFNNRTVGFMVMGDKIEGNYAQIFYTVRMDDNSIALQNVASQRYIAGVSTDNSQYRTSSTKKFGFTPSINEEFRYERVYDFIQTGSVGLSAVNGKVVRAAISDDGPNRSNAEWTLQPVELSEAQIAEALKTYQEYIDAKTNGYTYGKAMATYFEDDACTILKEEYKNMTDEALVTAIGETLNRQLIDVILKMKNDKWATYTSGKNWEKLYRIQDYKPYSNEQKMGAKLVLNPWSRVNNPTGITSGAANSPLYVFVEEFMLPAGAVLKAEFLEDVNLSSSGATTLKKGLNVLFHDVPNTPLFIFYETKDGDLIADYKPIKIHIEGGDVNGYFNTLTQTDEDWVDMWNDGLFAKAFGIDVLGQYVVWHMNKVKVHEAVGDKPTRMMKIWDRIVETEINLMGIKESEHYSNASENLYPSVYNNRMAAVSATKNYMWSQNGGTFYEQGTLASVLNFDEMNGGGALWGPAHEIGHNNQTAIKLVGTTEVSNNLFSNVVVHEFDKITTRYWGIQGRADGMNLSWPEFYNYRSNVVSEPIGHMNRMFFTLYLYYHVLGNQPDFYQRIFENLRHDRLIHANSETNPTYAKNDYLKFAMAACDAAQEDLTEFFDFWGFFKPCDEIIGDYSTNRLVNDEKQVAEWKATLAAKGYRKNGNILFLDDRAEQSYQADGVTPKGYMEGYSVANCENKTGTFTAFKANAIPQGYSATVSTNGAVRITAGTGAVGYKIYDEAGLLQYVATKNSFTLPSWITDKKGVCIVAAAADPANDAIIYGKLQGIDNITIDTNNCEQVIYDLSGRRVQKASQGFYIINGKKVLVK